ncbi:hypothetical protein [Streptococcus merionis]|uniref:hypothetical protein n=1 Tax=Streptococcus merionis TaxID=400065 RepID=UPI0026F0EA06|nr:hypothetical protein [Streptococcus merionis]
MMKKLLLHILAFMLAFYLTAVLFPDISIWGYGLVAALVSGGLDVIEKYLFKEKIEEKS